MHVHVIHRLSRHGADVDADIESLRAVLDHDPNDAVAALLLDRCSKRTGPHPGDSQTEGLERLKTNYEESAYWQLKAVLQPHAQ